MVLLASRRATALSLRHQRLMARARPRCSNQRAVIASIATHSNGSPTCQEVSVMKTKRTLITAAATLSLAALGGGALWAAGQDKYELKVPGGLAFSEFKGYESWEVVSTSRNERVLATIVGNPAMIEAFKAGYPGNGKAAPDGAKMAKMHWSQKQMELFPQATVPDKLVNVDFMVKDSKRFADTGGWGY